MKHTLQEQLSIEQTLLSAERTFLSWIRTALAVIAGGLAIARFIAFKTLLHAYLAHFVGQILIALGGLLCIFALVSYRRIYIKWGPSQDRKKVFQGLTVITLVLLIIVTIIFALTFGAFGLEGGASYET